MVKQRPSRYGGFDVSVVGFQQRDGWWFRAYLHTPDWRRIAVVGVSSSSADAAAQRVEVLFASAVEQGVVVAPRRARRPLRLSDPATAG